MNRFTRGCVTVLLCSLAFAFSLAVQAGEEPGQVTDGDLKLEHGQVNYTSRVITATGSGAPDLQDPRARQNVAVARLGAERVAKMDALRNILETLKGVQVTSELTVEKEMVTNEKMRTRIEGVARNFRVLNTKYYADGGVDVIVEMSLNGPLASTVVEPGGKGADLPGKGASKNTGLVIDARGLKAVPALSPRIVDEAGKLIYSVEYLDKATLEAAGVVGYYKDIESAKASKRVATSPLVLKALKLAEGGKTDIVLSNADAEKLRDPESNLKFLAEGKVVIVVD
jgi:hypothetical protein